jgi:hypothetical protein
MEADSNATLSARKAIVMRIWIQYKGGEKL